MTKFSYISFIVILSFLTIDLSAQFTLPFGKVSLEDLSNKPYKPDPGADAIILSESGLASLQYQDGIYIELEKNVRIRIVNSKGYHFASIEIPFDIDDKMDYYKASTFNLQNGEKIETQIPRKSFIIEKTDPASNTLKFNFPDVHEGSVIEYSYKIRLKNSSAIMGLVTWVFQSVIPVVRSTFTVAYPDAFVYKSLILGSSLDVQTDFTTSNSNFFGRGVTANIRTWSAADLPAFRPEPGILGVSEHLTRVTFELASVEFPNITFGNISPTYQKLNEKLLDRDDFGTPLATNFRSLAQGITAGEKDELSKLRKIHEYVSSKILWDGDNGITSSSSLKAVMRKEKGNSADINMMLIAMLRSAGLKADPVILSTRSHGTLFQNSAMIRQFNYLIAAVTIEGKLYLADATDPLRPADLLPVECLNRSGRLIHLSESRFVELKNDKPDAASYDYNVKIDEKGQISGTLNYTLSGYEAYYTRKTVKLAGEDGYLDLMKSMSPYADISSLGFMNREDPGSDLVMKCDFNINDGARIAGDKILFKTFLSMERIKNPFFSADRKYPVDLAYPSDYSYSIRFTIPEGYVLSEKPSDASFTLETDGGKYEYSCLAEGNQISVHQKVSITRTLYQTTEYLSVRNFYEKIVRKQGEVIVLKKNPVIK